jgi:CheY-like chemotaxis protein
VTEVWAHGANGEEALASVAQRAPDLILLDAIMPGMDGFQVVSRLKAHSLAADAESANVVIPL